MIRYPAYDPPEYIDWQPKATEVEQFSRTLEEEPQRLAIVGALPPKKLLEIYEGLVRNRLHDIALKRWVKQGVISKAWLGTGEEATTIGAVHALNRWGEIDANTHDFIAPMIRNAGACHEMGMSLADMMRGYLGTADSPTRGRDLHIGAFDRGVIAPISHVGDIMAVTTGIALAFKMRREPRLALTWIGDGSTKNGVFHESMNFAAVQRLPFIVIIQNNQVALGTALDQHQRGRFEEWPAAYGVAGGAFDGNNVLDTFAAVKIAADLCRKGEGPVLLVAETFRMGGHATHDEREARVTFDQELFEQWGKRDPIGLFETYLIEGKLDLESGSHAGRSNELREKNMRILAASEQRVIEEVERAAEEALASKRDRMPKPEAAADGVYADENLSTVRHFALSANVDQE
jgi:pyruvate dehydrogenase E1 component alpha subunit/2-oxoisovalerate dehydrogenase E1 component alpha subunit